MDSTRTSTLEEISQKLKDNIDMYYWRGRGNRQSFRQEVKKLVSDGVLSKDEYNYLLKNERRVLVKTQLLHLIPELQSQEVIEITLKHLSNVIFGKKYKEAETRKEDLENQIIRQISDHMKSTLHPKATNVREVFKLIREIVQESSNISDEYIKISNQLLEVRDGLLEKGASPMLLHEIDKMSTKLIFASKSNNPDEMPGKDELVSMLNEIQLGAGVTE